MKSLRAGSSRRRWFTILALCAAGVGLLALLLWILGPVSWMVAGNTVRRLNGKERADALNSVRQTMLAAVGGASALLGLGFTGGTYYLSKRAQVTDRYGKAAVLLASEKPEERLSGVYALEQVMLESPRDHGTIVEVLAAFVRKRTKREAPEPGEPQAEPDDDVTAAMIVLSRRPQRPEVNRINLRKANLCGLELFPRARLDDVDLTGADLRGTVLPAVRLDGALLDRANLGDASWRVAVLRNAWLEKTEMRNIDLDHADLSSAYLKSVDMSGCTLKNAKARRTWFDNCTLFGVHLESADLESARVVESVLDRALLCKTVLTRAWLDESQLNETDVNGAVFTETSLHRTHLERAQLLRAEQIAVANPRKSTLLREQVRTDPRVIERIRRVESGGHRRLPDRPQRRSG